MMTDNQTSGRLRAFGAEIVRHAAMTGGTLRLSSARLLATGDSLARNRRRPSWPDPPPKTPEASRDTRTP